MATNNESKQLSPGVDSRGAYDLRPIPDPTVLTTQALVQSIAALREILEAKIDGNSELFKARSETVDHTLRGLQIQLDRIPVVFSERINALQALHEERFNSIQKQFTERDVRTEQSAKDSKVAVDAALQAAKEAVGEQNKTYKEATAKAEASFTKQIDGMVTLISANAKAADDKISDLKDRIINRGDKGKDDNRANMAIGIAAVVAMFELFQYFGVKVQQQSQTQQPIYVPAPAGTVLPANPPQPAPR
jgi:hypothetical protein